jgi:hypothetical protein
MKSSFRRNHQTLFAIAFLTCSCLLAQRASAALVYGYKDPGLVLDTNTNRIWLPIDATNDDIARLAALGKHLHFPDAQTLRALWAVNFDVPVPFGGNRRLDEPLDPAVVDLMEFMGGSLNNHCIFGEAECYSISGWSAGYDGSYEVYILEYWAIRSGSAIGSVSTIGSYPFPNPCDGGLPFTCSDTRFLVMSQVPLPAGLWLLASDLCAMARRRVVTASSTQQHFPRL